MRRKTQTYCALKLKLLRTENSVTQKYDSRTQTMGRECDEDKIQNT
jgi:hypothetical protein